MMNSDELIYWIWLSRLNGIGPVMQRRLLGFFNAPKDIYDADVSDLIAVKGISDATANVIVASKSLDAADMILRDAYVKGIAILTLDNPEYPDRLKNISDIPPILYDKGILKPLGKTAGVVGPRRCTREARQIAIDISTNLAKEGFTIISGMALGIDSYAHTAAIKNNAYTIAVPGCGADICYPRDHLELYYEIEKKGLLLSQFPPGIRPETYNFPKRNKIIAAMSDELYVIQPTRRSGSLITARYAKDYGKKVHIITQTTDD